MARVASGVVVVTTVADGMDHAMTANSFTSVSLEPRLVLFCVQQDSRFHEAIVASPSWVVNLLAGHQAAVAKWFSERGRPLVDQLDHFPHSRNPEGIGLLSDTIGWLTCRTEQLIPAGDHTVVIGRVDLISESDPASPPLLFLDRRLRPACD